MKIMQVMSLPQDANAHPYVQLYVQLPMKHYNGAFLVSLDNATLLRLIKARVTLSLTHIFTKLRIT